MSDIRKTSGMPESHQYEPSTLEEALNFIDVLKAEIGDLRFKQGMSDADVVRISALDELNLRAMERDYERMKKALEEAEAERKTLNSNAVARETYEEAKHEIALLRKKLAESKEPSEEKQMMGLKKKHDDSYEPKDLPSAIHLIERLKDKIDDDRRYGNLQNNRIILLETELNCWKKLHEIEVEKSRRMRVDSSQET